LARCFSAVIGSPRRRMALPPSAVTTSMRQSPKVATRVAMRSI
jgi:hypothetical protein